MCLVSGWPVFCGVVMAAAALDLVTKRSIFAALGMPGEGRRIEFIPGVFVLETNLNEGALFGIGQGLSWLFATVSLAALALICGGIIGNLYDRLGLPGLQWHAPLERVGQPVYAVRDWIHVIVPGVIDWPIFNLADSWLVIGAGMLFWSSFRQPATDDRQPPSDRACPA